MPALGPDMDARHLLVPAGKRAGRANEAVCRMFLESPAPPAKAAAGRLKGPARGEESPL